VNLKNKTIKALGWDLSGRFASQGVSFVISILLARLLSPQDFGVLAMVNVVVAVATVFIDMGFGSSLVQRSIITEEHYNSVFVFNIMFGLFLSVLLFMCSGSLARFYENKIIEDVGRVMSLIFVLNAFGSVVRIKLYKELNFKALSLATLFGTVIGGTIGVLMAFMGYGIWSLVAQSLLSLFLTTLYCYFSAKWFPKIIFKLKILKELWSYSFHIFISTIIGIFFGQLDNLVIGKLFASAKLGYYYRAKSMESLIHNYTSQSLLSVLFPSMSSVKEDRNRFNSIVFKAYHIICFFSFFLLGLLYLVSEDLMVILFSEKWLPSVPYFRILLLSSFVYPMGALFNAVLASKGNSKAFLHSTIVRYVILLPTYFVLFHFEIDVFLYSFCFATILSLFTATHYASKEMRTSALWFYKTLIPYISINALITILLEQINHLIILNHFLHLSLFTALFLFSYIFLSKLFGIEGYKLSMAEFHNIRINA